MKILEVLTQSDPVLTLIQKAVDHYGAERLMGGNCGQFALALAHELSKSHVHLQVAVICYDAFEDDAHVTPQDIMQADVDVYHVALVKKPYFYDADGKVTGNHILHWIKQEYGDSYPALFMFDLAEPGLEALIRTDTAWSISSQQFQQFFDAQIQEGAYQGGLRKWFKQNWRDISRKVDGAHPPCGASAGKQGRDSDPQRAYPKCVPARKASKMTPAEKKSAVRRKRRVEREPGAAGKVDRVKT